MLYQTLHLKQNDCYKAGKTIVPKGIVVHSTGANNPTLRRYIGPDDGILGKNLNSNDWNRPGIDKCVHAFIGLDKNGQVRCYNTLPWNHRAWGCASGPKGSYNNSHIQFEICEDALTDKAYFEKAFALAVELCAMLCQQYKLDVSSIVSHKEANLQGYASDHSDPHHWLARFGWTMDTFRQRVAARLQPPALGKLTVIYAGNDGLNVRSGPSTSASVIGVARLNEVFTVMAKVDGWYQLKSGAYITDKPQYVKFVAG